MTASWNVLQYMQMQVVLTWNILLTFFLLLSITNAHTQNRIFIVEDTWHFFVTQLEFHNSSTGDYNMRFAKLIACVSTCSMKHSIVMKITTPFLYTLTLQIMPIQTKNNQPVPGEVFWEDFGGRRCGCQADDNNNLMIA